MTSRDSSEAIRRFEQNSLRLRGAVALARLLTDLDRRDEDARELLERARSALAEGEQKRQTAGRFLGPRAYEQLREAERTSAALLEGLGRRAEKLSPGELRRALQRSPRRPRQELVDLLGYFLEDESRWTAAHVHKVDLLLTRLGRPSGRRSARPGGSGLEEALASLQPTGIRPVGEFERKTFARRLKAIGDEIEAADSLGELIEDGTLRRYRELKHRLGRLLLHPDLRPEILKTNLALEDKIQRLNSRAVTGIFSAYQGIFEIGFKGGIDEDLRGEIDQLQVDFDRFERRIHEEEVRLSELEAFWGNLRSLAARLHQAAAEQAEPTAEEPEPGRRAARRPHEPPDDWLAEDLQALLDILRESDREGWPTDLVSLPADEGFQIDGREVLALRRLRQDEEADQALETFLLEGAALRRAIKRAARQLATAASSASLRELPEFARARDAVSLSESYLARYSQAVEQAVVEGDVEDAQRLQILRMRLVRESAGIWLQVYQQS